MECPRRDKSSSRRGAARVSEDVGMKGLLAMLGVASTLVAGGACKSSHDSSQTTSGLCVAVAPGPAQLRRLTRFEVGRSLADVMGVDPALADDLPPDEESEGYDNSSSAYSVSALHAQKLLDLGEAAAAAFLADGGRASSFAGCDPTSDGDACLRSFVQAFGARLWRRPLGDDEVGDMAAVAAATGGGGRAGTSAVVAAMIQSPGFLYRAEAPAPAGAAGVAARLPADALATRLAYLVTSSAPDADLLSATRAGFAEETRQFLADVWHKGPTLERLLTSNTTFVDLNLADFYGYPLPAAP